MTKVIALLLAATAGASLWHFAPAKMKTPPAASPRRLAPEGVYFLTEYVSVPIRGGVIGWVPGQPLREVAGSPHPEGSLLLSDGKLQRLVECATLTQDVDEATTVRAADERMQSQIKAWIAGNTALAAARQREYAILTAADLERAQAHRTGARTADSPAATDPSAAATAQTQPDQLTRSVQAGKTAVRGETSKEGVSALVQQQRGYLQNFDTVSE